MKSISGIYDGSKIQIMDAIQDNKKYKVIITFLEEIVDEESLAREFSAQTKGLDFWQNIKEDLYQDYLPVSNESE